MRKHNAENERIKRAYFIYLKEARRLSEHSIDAAAAAIARSRSIPGIATSKDFIRNKPWASNAGSPDRSVNGPASL